MVTSSSDGTSSSAPDSEEPASLYDPPFEDGEDMGPDGDENHETLRLRIPREMARRLLRVSMHLGLSPSLVASRAIDLVWDEIGTVSDDDSLSTQTLIQRYQARVDILQIMETGLEEEADGNGMKSASSESPRTAGADGDTSERATKGGHPEGDQLWDAVDKINDVLSDEEASGEDEVPTDGPRRPEKEPHSWDEVDEIIDTGEDAQNE